MCEVKLAKPVHQLATGTAVVQAKAEPTTEFEYFCFNQCRKAVDGAITQTTFSQIGVLKQMPNRKCFKNHIIL